MVWYCRLVGGTTCIPRNERSVQWSHQESAYNTYYGCDYQYRDALQTASVLNKRIMKTEDSLIKTLMQNFTFFTRASRFKTFESWFLQYIEHTKRMIETHGNITFHHLMIANAILTLDHMVRYKTWMRNKRVEFPQGLSDIYADTPKFIYHQHAGCGSQGSACDVIISRRM